MIEHAQVSQRHVDWFNLRMGKVTASELHNLLTPNFEPRKGKTPLTYLYLKLAEVWRGKPIYSAGAWATEQGSIREDFAIPFLQLEKGWKIRSTGLIETDDHLASCSPDGVVDGPEPFGVEVKCPEPVNHVRYLAEGVLPEDYVTQVYGSLFVTGFSKWVFASYHNDYPAFILEISSDPKINEKIGKAIADFHKRLELLKDRMEGIT